MEVFALKLLEIFGPAVAANVFDLIFGHPAVAEADKADLRAALAKLDANIAGAEVLNEEWKTLLPQTPTPQPERQG